MKTSVSFSRTTLDTVLLAKSSRDHWHVNQLGAALYHAGRSEGELTRLVDSSPGDEAPEVTLTRKAKRTRMKKSHRGFRLRRRMGMVSGHTYDAARESVRLSGLTKRFGKPPQGLSDRFARRPTSLASRVVAFP